MVLQAGQPRCIHVHTDLFARNNIPKAHSIYIYIYIYAHPAHDPRFSVASVDHGGGGG